MLLLESLQDLGGKGRPGATCLTHRSKRGQMGKGRTRLTNSSCQTPGTCTFPWERTGQLHISSAVPNLGLGDAKNQT